MSATVIGDITFGITAETGFYIESASFDYSIQEKYIADGDGDDVAGALYKPEMTFSLDGAYKTTGSPTWVLGGAITIANIPTHTAFISGYTSGGRVLVTSVGVTAGNETEQRRAISGVFKPFMT